jgi:energy-coupling factor transporter ATP-binding protein EcfA2
MGVGIGVRSVGKSYGAVEVLRDLSLDLRAGSCTALIGENGAGKSTLVGIISGKIAPSSGAVLVDGPEVRFRSPRDARANGVAAIPSRAEKDADSPVSAVSPRRQSSAIRATRALPQRRQSPDRRAEAVPAGRGVGPQETLGRERGEDALGRGLRPTRVLGEFEDPPVGPALGEGEQDVQRATDGLQGRGHDGRR